jgi:transcriptional regulator with XRE-family HTH domain
MSVQTSKFTIRSRKLGLKLHEARSSAGKSQADCATELGSSVDEFELFETGEQSPSLPELEILASFFGLPLDYFWSEREQSAGDGKKKAAPRQLVGLRQRKLGALLRAARLQAGLTLEQLSEATSLKTGLLESYELGEVPVPFPELEVIAQVLNRPLGDFSSKPSQSGGFQVFSPATREFTQLSPELQAFIAKPINRPYLELAVKLSQLDADRLRSVAEALLAITY